ncbi:MAG: vitamin K epoxide reductase family protein [Candidatus Wolfebacteria bacterium]|nr:vitamin K epoxide reductase family protein [Candidatus Wolfebacteria bacterium]
MEKEKSNLMPKWLVISFISLGLLGFFDASYLTFTHYQNINLVCLGGESCDKVTASVYSSVGQIPVALLGALYYAVIISLSAAYLWFSRKKYVAGSSAWRDFMANLLPRFTILGLLASAWFVYLQLFVIKEICVYCMGSALTSAMLFILGILAIQREKKMEIGEETAPI